MRKAFILLFGLGCLAALSLSRAFGQSQNAYDQKDLVTDPSGPVGPPKDASLINPWGICIIPGDPFWVADNASPGGVTTLYTNTGSPMGSFVVAPPAHSSNPATPTGCVGNVAGTGFNVTAGTTNAPSLFIFATEDGTISGWNGTGGSTILAVDNSATSTNPKTAIGAVYKGLALLKNNAGTFLLATNFHAATVEAYDANFALANTQFTGGFLDTNPPAVPAGVTSPGGYAPFGIHIVNNQIMVTYALQNSDPGQPDDKHDPLKIAGTGYVDVFDPNTGMMLQRIGTDAQNIVDPQMNAPWGVVIPPSTFGSFGANGNLLVGNFGDGAINAFTFPSGAPAFVDQMKDGNGAVILNAGLWDMVFDSTGKTGVAGTMYFTAGGPSEATGLFAAMTPHPASPPATPDFNMSVAPTSQTITAGQMATFTITVGSLDSFNSSVALSCAGNQIDSTCTLSPTSVTPPKNGNITSTATINTNANPYQTASLKSESSRFFAMLVPIPVLGFLGLFVVGSNPTRLQKRGLLHRLFGSFFLFLAVVCFLGANGCYSKKTGSGTQRSTNTITITGTSGGTSHTTTMTLTVM